MLYFLLLGYTVASPLSPKVKFFKDLLQIWMFVVFQRTTLIWPVYLDTIQKCSLSAVQSLKRKMSNDMTPDHSKRPLESCCYQTKSILLFLQGRTATVWLGREDVFSCQRIQMLLWCLWSVLYNRNLFHQVPHHTDSQHTNSS